MSRSGWGWCACKLCYPDLHVVNSSLKFVHEVLKSLHTLCQVLEVSLVRKCHLLSLSMGRLKFGEIISSLEACLLKSINFSLKTFHSLAEFVLVEHSHNAATTRHLRDYVLEAVNSLI